MWDYLRRYLYLIDIVKYIVMYKDEFACRILPG